MNGLKIGLGIAIMAAFTGCVGFVGGDGGGGDVVVDPGPDAYFFGGGYERGRDVHDYSNRGFQSRAVAHPEMRSSARSAPARSGGGGGEKKR